MKTKEQKKQSKLEQRKIERQAKSKEKALAAAKKNVQKSEAIHQKAAEPVPLSSQEIEHNSPPFEVNNFSRAFEAPEASKLLVKPFQKEPGLKLKLKPTQLLNSGSKSRSGKSIKDASPVHCKTPEDPQKPSNATNYRPLPLQPAVPPGLNIQIGNVYYQ